jgi:hypothetical protein
VRRPRAGGRRWRGGWEARRGGRPCGCGGASGERKMIGWAAERVDVEPKAAQPRWRRPIKGCLGQAAASSLWSGGRRRVAGSARAGHGAKGEGQASLERQGVGVSAGRRSQPLSLSCALWGRGGVSRGTGGFAWAGIWRCLEAPACVWQATAGSVQARMAGRGGGRVGAGHGCEAGVWRVRSTFQACLQAAARRGANGSARARRRRGLRQACNAAHGIGKAGCVLGCCAPTPCRARACRI